MASGSLFLVLLTLASFTVLLPIAAADSTTSSISTYSFVQSTGPAPSMPREKLSHLRFFWHDLFGSVDPTVISVAGAPTTNASSTLFGMVAVFDDPMTEGPELSSLHVGHAQGTYTSASKSPMALLVAQTFAFTVGEYNGSSITILGRNVVSSAVREMPIVGGTGLFRWARGYVQARTYKRETTADHVEYNVYVLHY